ncbi:MAG: response regulator [Pseudomonadota bacterium]
MNTKKALIVDDSRLAQFVLKKMLVEHHLDVDTSESAEEAFDYLQTQKPDLIFLDHTMPGMNGLEALKVIKGNPDTAAIPVMMYTSQEDSGYMSQAREMGAVDVLPKQLKASELHEALVKLDKTQEITDAIRDAANTSAAEDSEELKQLVRDAETALTKETELQKLRIKIDEQQDHIHRVTLELAEKSRSLIADLESAKQKQSFWNNLLWGVIYSITVAVFALMYFQQKDAIDRLQVQVNIQSQSRAVSAPQIAASPATTTPAPPQSAGATAEPADTQAPAVDNTEALNNLQTLMNTDNQIPFGELLISDTVLDKLNELIPALQALEFSGRVSVLAHDGRFCLNTGDTSGQLNLAADDTPVTQCQFSDPSDRLADIASIDVLRLITISNQSPDNNFVIIINPQNIGSPAQRYPAENDKITAGNWNSVALKNRRIEFQLLEGN